MKSNTYEISPLHENNAEPNNTWSWSLTAATAELKLLPRHFQRNNSSYAEITAPTQKQNTSFYNSHRQSNRMYFCIIQLVKNGENSISRATLSSSSYRCKQLTQQLSVIFKVPINQFASIIYITNTGSFPNKCYSEDKTYLVQHSPFKHR